MSEAGGLLLPYVDDDGDPLERVASGSGEDR